MFADIIELMKFIYTSDLFFELFSMVWTVGIVFLVFNLIRRV